MRRRAFLVLLAVAATSCVRGAAPVEETTPSVAPSPSPSPSPYPDTMEGGAGALVATLTVPRLALDDFPMLMGTTTDILAVGVGVYVGAATPGSGNLATAGHRVTPVQGSWHGPYYDLDKLVDGDRAWVEFEGRTYEYAWRETVITTPDDVSVLADGVADLTMTACHPKGFLFQRIVAFWQLVGSAPTPASELATPAPLTPVASPVAPGTVLP